MAKKVLKIDPNKKKIVGYTTKRTPGEVVVQGSPTKVTQSAERGSYKKTYTPTTAETGKKEYGPVRTGKDPEMNRLLADARAKKRDVTEYSSKGLHYKAGETKIEEGPVKFRTSIDVKPTIRKVNTERTPIYKPEMDKKVANRKKNLKPMDLTFGGEDRRGSPANKFGLGTKKKFILRKTKSYKKK